VESEIRKIDLGQNQDQREQKELEDQQGPTPPLHEATLAGGTYPIPPRSVNREMHKEMHSNKICVL
jgi:hypothetical protein